VNKQPEELIPTALQAFEHLRITDTTDIPPPIPIITINGEIISTECNMTTISGSSKSGKSAFTGIILAGAISMTGNIDGLEYLEVKPNTDKKAVLHFDTEQARHKHQSNLKSILKRANYSTCPEYFLSYNIRALDIAVYQEATLKICEAANASCGGVHLIVIDGIADFISDVNETVPANAIVKFFEDLAIKFNCPLITIVHTNPGSDKERGHLGSQCQRKSESVLSIKNEDDISFMEPKLLRMAGKGDIPILQFAYNKDKGYHVGLGVKSTGDDAKQEKHRAELQKVAIKVFGGQKSFLYNDAYKEIIERNGFGIGKAKRFLSEMNELNIIYQDDSKYYRLS
jgi:hypothetical protein